MTIGKTWPGQGSHQSSDRPLQGRETFELYLAEMSRSVVALAEQSALLLEALGERAALLTEAEQAPAPAKAETPCKEPGGPIRQ